MFRLCLWMDKVIIKSPMILLFCTVMEDVQEKLICDLVYIFMYKYTHHVDNQTVSHSRARPFCMHAYLLLIRLLPFWLLFLWYWTCKSISDCVGTAQTWHLASHLFIDGWRLIKFWIKHKTQISIPSKYTLIHQM